MQRHDLTFASGDASCSAWLYHPDQTENSSEQRPLVILAHGLGATRELRLDPFASRFVEAG